LFPLFLVLFFPSRLRSFPLPPLSLVSVQIPGGSFIPPLDSFFPTELIFLFLGFSFFHKSQLFQPKSGAFFLIPLKTFHQITRCFSPFVPSPQVFVIFAFSFFFRRKGFLFFQDRALSPFPPGRRAQVAEKTFLTADASLSSWATVVEKTRSERQVVTAFCEKKFWFARGDRQYARHDASFLPSCRRFFFFFLSSSPPFASFYYEAG